MVCANSRRRYRPARAFNLVELFVVLAMLGLLVALLLPVLQASREAARRIVCSNNLRQNGVGLHAYHHSHGSFPPDRIEWRPPGNTANRQIAWSALLLPFIGEQDVYGLLDLTTAFDSPQNAPAAVVILPIYRCPSSPHPGARIHGRGRYDYGGIYGERLSGPKNPPKGTLLYDLAIRLEGIRDGASRTLIISEDTAWPDGQWINGRNVFDQAYPINAAPRWENDIHCEHRGSANGLFADCSVRILHEDMNVSVLAAVCTRAGAESRHDF